MTDPTPLTFRAHGTPRPQPRAKRVKGRFVSTVDPKAKLWRIAVERACKEALATLPPVRPVFTGAVRVHTIFTFLPPASALDRIGQPHTQVPDADNLSKLVLDVMKVCGVYRDDAQASQTPPEKWWGAKAGVAVVVEPIGAARREDARAAFQTAPDWLRG